MIDKSVKSRERFVLMLIILSVLVSGFSLFMTTSNQNSNRVISITEISSGSDAQRNLTSPLLISSIEEIPAGISQLVKNDTDFKSNSIVFIPLGERPTGGYAIRISNFSISNKTLTVKAAEQIPGGGCFLTSSFTSPYILFEINAKPSTLVVDWNKEIKSCV